MSKKIVVCVLAFALFVALVGCVGGSTAAHNNTSPTTLPGDNPPAEETTIPLVAEPAYGTWAWEDDARYRLVLNEDGTGSRGMPNAIQTFAWQLQEHEPGRLLIRVHTSWEYWEYTAANGTLTITSLQREGMTFSYTRVA